jgi:hypothetical protein
MGTTLTGTTPQDTYDSLIKVTDNGPLSGSLKTLTDGLGNDSALALSTGAASITGTLAVSGNATFDTNTLFVDAANNRVGFGTPAPISKVDVLDGVISAGNSTNVTQTNNLFEGYGYLIGSTRFGLVGLRSSYNNANNRASLDFYTTGAGGYTEKMRISTEGDVGIGTSSPESKLHVSNDVGTAYDSANALSSGQTMRISNASTTAGISANLLFQAQGDGGGNGLGVISGVNTSTGSLSFAFSTRDSGGSVTEKMRILSGGGLTFNGATAAANALDDYEEGTFTLTFAGEGTAGTYTPTAVNATYTKIGRVVTLQYKATFAGGASGGSGNMIVSGLPFTYASDNGGMVANIILSDASWGGSYLSMLPTTSGSGTTLIIVETAPSTGLTNFVQAGDFNTSTDIRFTLTYQV